MFRQRILVVLILTPLWIFVIFKGGMVFASVMAVALSIAAWEYRNMFTIGGYQPAAFALISGAVSFPLAKHSQMSGSGFHTTQRHDPDQGKCVKRRYVPM